MTIDESENGWLDVRPLMESHFALCFEGRPTAANAPLFAFPSAVALRLEQMDPLVSVLLTVYKRTKFLPNALESALSQSFTDYEIIVADDSGNSVAASVCRPHSDAGRIRYRANRETIGVANSLRVGMDEARGRYIAILNDDDIWEPDFLACLLPPLRSHESRVLAFSDHWIINENGTINTTATEANTRRYGRHALAEGELKNAAEFVLIQNGVPLAMAAVFRKDALNQALLTRDVAGAYDFWISCLLAASGGRFFYVPRRLTRYRVHSEMESSRRSPDQSENQIYIFAQLLQRGWFPELNHHLRLRLAAALFSVGRDRLYFNRPAEARKYFRRAYGMRAGWKPVVAGLASFSPRPLRKRLGLSGDAMT